MMKYIIFSFIIFSSCSKLLFPVETSSNPIAVFDYTHKKVKENYSFFELKKINWDSLSKVYRNRLTSKTSKDSLFLVINDYLAELKDGHVNIFTKNNKGRYWNWFNDYPNNFNRNYVEQAYWGKNYEITGPFIHNWIDSIGYIYYGSFSNGFSNDETDYIFKKYSKSKGLIIDVRDNGGGSTTNVLNLAGRFVKTKTWVGCTYEKISAKSNDFDNSKDIFINPEGSIQFLDKPIIILTNRRCYSATSFFSAFMATLPNVLLVGDRTGGGSGIPISSELPNGWSIRYSASKTENADGKNFELGMEPDFLVHTGASEELNGKDLIIEKALELINLRK